MTPVLSPAQVTAMLAPPDRRLDQRGSGRSAAQLRQLRAALDAGVRIIYLSSDQQSANYHMRLAEHLMTDSWVSGMLQLAFPLAGRLRFDWVSCDPALVRDWAGLVVLDHAWLANGLPGTLQHAWRDLAVRCAGRHGGRVTL